MDFLIVTGLSGAGKSRALGALEDIGYFCVDNLPPTLIPKFAELARQSHGQIDRVAVITDLRGGSLFEGLFESLDEIRRQGLEYRVLFLEASEEVLLNRYRQTRRRHPLACGAASLETVIEEERRRLLPARERADYIIDTSLLSPAQLKERIAALFAEDASKVLLVGCMSFGFKYGAPTECDLVFDLRCMPNPYWIPELRTLSGLDGPVRSYVLEQPQAQGFLIRLRGLLDYLLPLYNEEGKSQLVIGFGCTGGRHRSVVFTEEIARHLREAGYCVSVSHRDIDR